ncbi:MAG: hypothetical protein HZC29_03245 [Thaumarchaeota archaeon]|nr:hypothetical protein [Nitrososphaerota archaeon]
MIPGNPATPVTINVGSTTSKVTLSQTNANLVVTGTTNLETIVIPESVNSQIGIDYGSIKVTGASSTTVTIPDGFDITFNTPSPNTTLPSAVNVTITTGTILTGPVGWNGVVDLPTTTTVTIPQTTTGGVTTTYSEVSAFVLGVSGSTIQLSSPVRIEFTGDGGHGNLVAFFVGPDGIITFINTTCSSDSASGVPTGANECIFDNGSDVIVWTKHFTKFGTSTKSTSSSAGSTTSPGNTNSGSGKTGVGPAGTSRGLGGFGGILSTPLTINEITYDKCEKNMATILVSSDADNAPSVTVHTAKSGSVSAKLAVIQPYEQLNKITKIDKYLYEIPITSDETFLLVVVTEEKGVSHNTVQSAVNLTSCEGATVISRVPEETHQQITSSAPKIFDVKFQIENNTQHRSETESEFSFVDNQDLSVSAIVDAQIPLKRSEL